MSYIGIPPFGQTIRSITSTTATSGQTTFNITGGYVVGYVDVFLNGILLTPSDYTATDGLSVVLASGATTGDEFQALAYQPVSLVDTYRKSEVDALVAGVDLSSKVSKTGDTMTGALVMPAGSASAPSITNDGDTNTGIFFPAADNIGFATNGVIRGRWTTDGLCFGSDTAAANALDDYEEGTVSQPLRIGSTNQVNYYSNFSRYTKIGNTVFYLVDFDTFDRTLVASGDVFVNLPFTSAAGVRIGYSMFYGMGSTTTSASTNNLGVLFQSSNSTVAELYTSITFGTQTSVPDTNERITVRFCFAYQVG